jgi:hypothetical protein
MLRVDKRTLKSCYKRKGKKKGNNPSSKLATNTLKSTLYMWRDPIGSDANFVVGRFSNTKQQRAPQVNQAKSTGNNRDNHSARTKERTKC